MNIHQIIQALLIPCVILIIALSYQSDANSASTLVKMYCLLFAFMIYVGYVAFNSGLSVQNVVNTLTVTERIMKWIPLMIIIATLLMVVINLGMNFGRITHNKMPHSYYVFSLLTNIFLGIEIALVVGHIMKHQGNIYAISDRVSALLILIGQIGLILAIIVMTITKISNTQE